MSRATEEGVSLTVLDRADHFAEVFPDSCVVQMTATMLSKSIIDASEPIRDMLWRSNVHDFSSQGQGEDERIYVDGTLIDPEADAPHLVPTRVSMYRPMTKQGDPRFWVYGLAKQAETGDAIAVGVSQDQQLVVVNLSVSDGEWEAVERALTKFTSSAPSDTNSSLARLITRLNEIAAAGPIPAVGSGDTAVGRTVETALGIEINSSRLPDWEDQIEIKSGRPRPNQRKSLFAQVPDWTISTLKSSKEILEEFGYPREDSFKLYVTVGAKPNPRNSRGLYLVVDAATARVCECSTRPELPEVAVWPTELLQARLLEKHQETCWVECVETIIGGEVHFQPIGATYTRSPRADLMPLMISAGEITVDHLIKKKDSRVREKGPLWKVEARSAPRLLPEAQDFKLLP